ncbi:hypothetical protein E8P82_11675 [Arthrobacter echini]|uniref:Uncharacterized protein n=1 Tax=Arthrobacter echini TaxID=1529066 RepID=A0A4S5E2K1_9MICC|nr:hypothetical protein [Arthrobacter echini]THJ65624.1 hypothetical protein E8P82_11675 [Arthrobacter echini]
MGPVDFIEHPAPLLAMSPGLEASMQLHLPELQAPGLEDILEDRLEAGNPSTNGTTGHSFGPVDVAGPSEAAQRFFED